jgi:O-antigen/teichoic acid export membrane protein
MAPDSSSEATGNPTEDNRQAVTFSGRVVVLLGTQVFGAALGVINGILLARLLGPAGKGDYYIVVLLPATATVLLQLGLPQAFSFFAARGQMLRILGKTALLTVALSAVAFLGVAIVVPLIHDAALGTVTPEQIVLAFVAFPFALNAMFTTAIVIGRQAVRSYAVANITTSVSTTILLIAILGGVGPSVSAALVVYVLSVSIQAMGFAIAARRVAASTNWAEHVSYRQLFGYGLQFYPGSIAGFFSYRVDAFLIAFLIADASTALGYYSMAVGLAEMVFFLPRAVSTLFFPHVAGASRQDADRQVAVTSRVTLVLTGAFAVALIPAAVAMIVLILPAFDPALLPLVVLLPGVVALGPTFVVSGYMTGIDRPGIVSAVSLTALGVNVASNLLLIPRYGIVGAAASSLISYSLSSLLLTIVASRLTMTRVIDFWVPRPSDVRYVLTTTSNLVRRVAKRASTASGDRTT